MWDGTYISDAPWRFTYQPALNPSRIRFALAMAGLPWARPRLACELACGQGLTVAIHAACHPDIAWTGVDFNAGHIASARALARAGRLENLTVEEEDLAVYCQRRSLPMFDLVGVVGTWSWLPTPQQEALRALLARHLSPAAAFCLDHNVLPGSNAAFGFGRILAACAGDVGARGEAMTQRVPAALDRAAEFFDVNPAFVGMHWRLAGLLESLRQADPDHLAHEFFQAHWRPAFFGDIATQMARCALRWAAPSQPSEHVASLHLTPPQQAFLASVEDEARREQFRDFVTGAARRKDIWISAEAQRANDRLALLADMRIILARPVDDFTFRAAGGLGEVALARPLYEPLLAALGRLKPLAIGDLVNSAAAPFTPDDVCDACAVLLDNGVIEITQDEAAAQVAAPATRALNAHILKQAIQNDELGWLASPVTGGGVAVPRLHRLFLFSRASGEATPQDWARFALATLAQPDKHDAATLGDAQTLHAAQTFESDWLPVYRVLHLVEPA